MAAKGSALHLNELPKFPILPGLKISTPFTYQAILRVSIVTSLR